MRGSAGSGWEGQACQLQWVGAGVPVAVGRGQLASRSVSCKLQLLIRLFAWPLRLYPAMACRRKAVNIEILLRKLGSPSQVAEAIAELDTTRLPVGRCSWFSAGTSSAAAQLACSAVVLQCR